MNKIPVLLYHDIFLRKEEAQDDFAVLQDNFCQQMDYLYKNGYTALSLDKIINSMVDKEVADSRKKVVLTFDDGDLSNHEVVLPLLKKMGFSATFFVTINDIGKKNKMDWSMIYDLSRNGMDVASHGLSHSFLTAHNDYTVLNELLLSKQILEKYTRKRVDFLSIPRGFYNKRVLTIARDVGFKAVCISDAGYNDFLAQDIFLLKRFTVRKNYGLRVFKSIVHGRPTAGVAILEAGRSRLRKLLGYQVYDKLVNLKYRNKPQDSV